MENHARIRGNPASAAFTLLELLVVISIIAVLAAITLPSLKNAQEAGQRAVCLSNIQQLSVAWTLYAYENDDEMCASDTEWNGIQPWNNAPSPADHCWVSDGPGIPDNPYCGSEKSITCGMLWPYLNHLDVYKCPTEVSGFARSYAISHAMGSIHQQNGERGFTDLAEIPLPSYRAVFIDIFPPYRDFDGSVNDVGPDGSVFFIDTFSKTWLSDIYTKGTYRHGNGCNMSFADGHVDNRKWKDPRTIKLMKKDQLGWITNEILEEYSENNSDIDQLYHTMKGIQERQF